MEYLRISPLGYNSYRIYADDIVIVVSGPTIAATRSNAQVIVSRLVIHEYPSGFSRSVLTCRPEERQMPRSNPVVLISRS